MNKKKKEEQKNVFVSFLRLPPHFLPPVNRVVRWAQDKQCGWVHCFLWGCEQWDRLFRDDCPPRLWPWFLWTLRWILDSLEVTAPITSMGSLMVNDTRHHYLRGEFVVTIHWAAWVLWRNHPGRCDWRALLIGQLIFPGYFMYLKH